MAQDVTRLEWNAANQLLHDANRILVVTHVRPDGDAIGSLLGLGLALREHGKHVTMVVDDGVPRLFRFLDGAADVLSELNPPPQVDLVISVDASSADRTGASGAVAFGLGKPVIVVDHHATNTFFGSAHIVRSSFVSTTEGILAWMDHLGWTLSRNAARALFMGILTDTIAFRVGPVTPNTLLLAHRFMEMGIDMRELILRTLGRVESGMLQLMGVGLVRAKLEENVIWSWLKPEDMAAYGFTTEQRPELSTELLQDEDAYISAFFLQTDEGDTRLSFRAIPGFDVASIAFQLGGGGHTLAAGCTIFQTPVEQAMEIVVPLLKAETRKKRPEYG